MKKLTVVKAAPKPAPKIPTMQKASVPDAIDLLVERLNKSMKGVGRIDRGRDIAWLDPPRIRTGILGLDIVSNGGLPRGHNVQFWGPWSSSKTTSLLKAMAAEQRRGNHVAFAAGEGFGKAWARKNGLYIPFSEEEYEGIHDPVLHAEMLAYDQWGQENSYGSCCIIQHVHGDGLLEMTAQAHKANVFSLIGVDSLAILKNSRQLGETPAGNRLTGDKATEIGDEERGGGGQIQMMGRFAARIQSSQNTRYRRLEDGLLVPDMNGDIPNNTCLVCLNQARSKMMMTGRGGAQATFQPPLGEALKHLWSLSILFTRGSELGEEEQIGDSKKWGHWGIEIDAKAQKSKVGPEGRRASWDLYIEDHPPFEQGAVDACKEVRVWGMYYEIIKPEKGSWLRLPNGKTVNGKEQAEKAIRGDEELRAHIEEEVIKAARRT